MNSRQLQKGTIQLIGFSGVTKEDIQFQLDRLGTYSDDVAHQSRPYINLTEINLDGQRGLLFS